jgi:predicted enzyme related to lactoylglutathione lyase
MAGVRAQTDGKTEALSGAGGRVVEIALAEGAIAWNECASPDVPKTREFFAGLFGWTVRSKEFGLMEGAYSTFVSGTHDVAGLLALSDLNAGSDRRGWFPVIRVADVDAAVTKACGLGAVLLGPPDGLPGLGRHAMLTGPSGVRYSLFDLHDGRSARGLHCVSWTELFATDPPRTALFCYHAFGWRAETVGDRDWGMRTIFTLQGERIASMRRVPAGESSRAIPCVDVADVDRAAVRAVELGGTLLDRRDDDPVMGRMIRITDPVGIEIIVRS